MTLIEIGIICGLIVVASVLAVVVSVWWAGRRTDDLRLHVAARLERLDAKLHEFGSHRGPSPAASAAPRPRPPSDYGIDTIARDQGRSPPPISPGSMPEAFGQAAATALEDQQSFREFAAISKGRGFMLRSGAEGAEPATGQNADLSADLWVVDDAGSRLVYPGFNLRRSQSALVADAGRLARERLDWLFDIKPGVQLGAARPARVAADGWTVIDRGILMIPLRAV